MSDKIEIGAMGEQLAAEFLSRKGWRVVCRNYRRRKAEIDLIVEKAGWILFVEVKTRQSSAYGEPEAFVNYKKRNMIMDAAEDYIFEVNWKGHIRFDIVSVKLSSPPEIIHFEDAIN